MSVNALIVCKSNRIVITKGLRTDINEEINEGHLGILKCKKGHVQFVLAENESRH